MEKEIGIYIHIPFCVKKCLYCDFVSGKCDKEKIKNYFEVLYGEIRLRAKSEKRKVDTIYFGGGTPSSVDSTYIVKTLETIFDNFDVKKDAEITIEVNPGTIAISKDISKTDIYKEAGFNRISIGLQSANDNELKLLGRIHSKEDFLACYESARKAGFNNINVDLMSAIPQQTLKSYEQSLLFVVELNPEHISSYSLILEEGTPFYDMYFEKDFISEEDERRMYVMTKDILREYGYERYEISNYCRAGYMSRHNSSYWRGVDYLGFGVASASLDKGIRTTNTYDIEKYIMAKNNIKEIPKEEIIKLSTKEMMEEYMFLGLRMMKGISKKEFSKRFDRKFDEVYGIIVDDMVRNNLMKVEGDNVSLTDNGIDVSNFIFSKFLL